MSAAKKIPHFMNRYEEQAINIIEASTGKPITEEQLVKLRSMIDDKKGVPESQEVFLSNRPGKVDSNGNDIPASITLERTMNWMASGDPCVSGYGTVFKNQENGKNYPGEMLEYLLKQRKVAKKEMFKHDKGSVLFNMSDKEQKVLKVLANSWYGALGQSAFQFYQRCLGPSVTYNGVIIITASMTAIEGFLANNIPFLSTSEIVQFISYVINEDFKFDVNAVVDAENIKSVDETLEYLVGISDFVLSDEDRKVVRAVLNNLSPEMLTRVYYKRNFLKFLENAEVLEILAGCFDPEFIDPDHPTEAIEVDIANLYALLIEFVAYDHIYFDRQERALTMKRESILVVDTDSNFVYLDPFYQFVKEHFDLEEENNDVSIMVCNVLTHILSLYIQTVLDTLTKAMNVLPKEQPRINMKSEFLYSRLLLTSNKKQYAGNIILQEGKPFDVPDFDMKGLSIRKVTVNIKTRKYFTDILRKQILDSDDINLSNIISSFSAYEQIIRRGLSEERSTQFTLPVKYGSFEGYKEPYQQQSVRGTLVWNALNPDSPIQPQEKVNLIKIKHSTPEDLEMIEDEEIRNVIQEAVFDVPEMAHYGFVVFCMPKTEEQIPEWLVPMIDMTTMISDNMKSALPILESVGVKVMEVRGTAYYTSLIEF